MPDFLKFGLDQPISCACLSIRRDMAADGATSRGATTSSERPGHESPARASLRGDCAHQRRARGCTSVGSVNTSADPDSVGKKAKSATPAKIKQPITIRGNEDGAKAQVTAVKFVNSVRSNDGFRPPDKGQRWVGVQFRIKNTGTVAYDDAPSNGAKVIDAHGQQFEADVTAFHINAGPMLPAITKVAVGGSALGYLVFSVPKASKVAKIQFSEDSGFADTAEWVVR